MARQIVLEVTQPYHVSGTEVLYAPGQQFPLDADLPPDVRVREVIAEVADAPVKAAKPAAPAAPAAPAVKPAAGKSAS